MVKFQIFTFLPQICGCVSSQTNRQDIVGFYCFALELGSPKIPSHLDEETELGEEVSGDRLGDDVVILNVGTGNLLVDVVDDLFHGI